MFSAEFPSRLEEEAPEPCRTASFLEQAPVSGEIPAAARGWWPPAAPDVRRLQEGPGVDPHTATFLKQVHVFPPTTPPCFRKPHVSRVLHRGS